MAVKGKTNNPKGKPVGTVNKSTKQAREAISMFVEGNVDRLTGWLDQIAVDSPKDAFDRFMSVVEYHIPKLARVDNAMLGANGQPIDPPNKPLADWQAEALDRWAADKYNLEITKEPKE